MGKINPNKITIREISKKIAKQMIVKNHYSHKWTSCRYALGIFYETDNEHTFFDEKDEKLATTALVVRINDKVQRLLNLVVNNDREAQNEPTIDAFKDLACYGIIAQIVKNSKWGK